jgi:hypothetical protein
MIRRVAAVSGTEKEAKIKNIPIPLRRASAAACMYAASMSFS